MFRRFGCRTRPDFEFRATNLPIAERAGKNINLQCFLSKGKRAGLVVVRSLLPATDRGARIRLLMDDFMPPFSFKLYFLKSFRVKEQFCILHRANDQMPSQAEFRSWSCGR